MRWLPPPGAVALGTLSQPLVPTSVADRPTDRVRLRAAGDASLLQLRSPRSPADTFAPRPAPPAPSRRLVTRLEDQSGTRSTSWGAGASQRPLGTESGRSGSEAEGKTADLGTAGRRRTSSRWTEAVRRILGRASPAHGNSGAAGKDVCPRTRGWRTDEAELTR